MPNRIYPFEKICGRRLRRREFVVRDDSHRVLFDFPNKATQIQTSLAILLCASTVGAFAAEKITYENDVQPILREHCFACHSQDEAKSGLALDSFDGLTTGGASGEVVAPSDPDSSRLWKLITHQEEPKMPPGDKLPEDQLRVLRAWIEGGLLKDTSSKPLKNRQPAVAKIDAAQLGKTVGDPAMPEQLYHEPVLWTPRVGPVDAIATSPWAPLVAVAWQRQVSFYNTDSHELLGIIPYVDGVPRVVRFSRDGSVVLVAGGRHAAAGSATLFDVKTGSRLATLGDELDIVLAADINPDLSLVGIGGPQKKVRVYRVSDGSLAYEISKHTEWITALAFSPDGKLLATADRNGSALTWQASAGHERADLRGHKAAITSLDWRADSAMIATASEDGTTRLWSPAGLQIKSVETHKGGVLSVRFAQGGNFVTAGRDRHVKTWKSDGSAINDLRKMPGMALAAAVTHDGTKVIASDYAGEVRVIDASSKQKVASLPASPKFLGERIADAENALRAANQELQTADGQVKTRLSALEQANAAHAAHEARLAEAQSTLSNDQSEVETIAKLHSQQEQLVAEKRQSVEQAIALLAEKKALLEQAQALPDDENANARDDDPEEIAELQEQIEAAELELASASKESEQAEADLAVTNEKRQAAEERLKAAEALLTQVQNETAGLPDLGRLKEALESAKTKAAAAKLAHTAAQRAKEKLANEQARFAQATKQFVAEAKNREAEQQALAKQFGKLEAQHEQAAEQLSAHREQLTAITEQLKSIQAEFAELQAGEAELIAAKAKLATELAKVQSSLAESRQAVTRLEASKQDFDKAEEIRKSYAAKTKTTAGQE